MMARAPMPALPPLPPAPPSGDGDSPPRHESGPVDEDLEVELDPSPSPLHDPTFIPVGSLRPRPSAQSAVPPDSDSPSDDRSPRGPARSRRAPLPPTEILRLALPKSACSGCPARLPSAYSVPGNTALDGPGPHACTSAPTTGPPSGLGDGDSPPCHGSEPVDEDLEVELDLSPSPLHDPELHSSWQPTFPTFSPVGSPPDSDSPSDDPVPSRTRSERRAPLLRRLALPPSDGPALPP